MALVSIRSVNKVYDGNVHAVKDVSLEVRDKEFMVFVGPSGCGKTTTLRMVAGLESITSGDILIGDTVVNNLPPMDRDIAMVFQNYALYPHMSVFHNMAFGLKMRKFEKPEIDKRVRDAAAILGIETLLDRKPRQLSGGQRQRVALGRAIVRHPQVFLFDEPLSNLDAKLRVQMRVELKKLHERLGTTAIYVTHDQVEAMTLGDRVVVMKDGIVQQVGEPLELYNSPANKFVAGFIGSPAMNFADVTLAESDGKLWAEAQGLRISIPGEMARRANGRNGAHATLGIRPEDIHLAGPADPADLCFDAEVEVIEQLGSEIVLDTRVGKSAFVASVDPNLRMKVHDRLKLAMNPRAAASVRRRLRGGYLGYLAGPAQLSRTSRLALRCSSRDFLKSWP
jgi:multiple sugar transport system ATP-binding protein